MRIIVSTILATAIGSAASAATVINNQYANTTVENGYFDVDINGNGEFDIGFEAFDYPSGTQEGYVYTYSYELNGVLYQAGIVDENVNNATVAKGFAAGDEIDENAGSFGGGSLLYVNGSGGSNGILAGAGSTGYLGFQILSSDNYGADDGYYFLDTPDAQYGYFEVSRGSVVLGSFGLQSTIGAAAIIPDPSVVPLPAGMPLLLAGLGGFAALRRRKNDVD